MSTDSQSRFDLEFPSVDPPAGPRDGAVIALDGDVLSCACPECSAPMSIRLWLMVADCWRCGTSIELTEEQEREALRLLKERGESQRQEPAAKAAKPPSPPKQPAPPPAARLTPPAPRPTSIAAPSPPQRQLAAHANRVKAHLREVDEKGEVELFWRAISKDLYAWLASLVIHLVTLIVLAIWIIEPPANEKPTLEIVLSTKAGDIRREGGRKSKGETDPIEFDKAGKDDQQHDGPDEPTPEQRKDEPDPGEKRGSDPKRPLRPVGNGTAAAVNPGLIAARQSTARPELVKQEGGTTATEAAVTRGLRWLAQHQNDDGSWSLDRFHKAGNCDGRCSRPGYNSDTAGTGLALLPFLGAGQTHRHGQYKPLVEKGLKWLIERQLDSGDLPSPFRNTHMYGHAMGAIALCEAYALTQDERLKDPAQRAIDFIIDAQHSGGGWRYQPKDRGDTSVVGWQLMALRSAQMAYLDVPPNALERAAKYLDDAQTDSLGGRYAYMPGNNATHVMTAEALLCRQYAGWPQDHPGLISGVDYLIKEHLPSPRERINMYYVYYATQVMHHMGGAYWEDWNYRVRDILVDTQEKKGHEAGSWTPKVGHDEAGGRLYQTALTICTLEVYYRHLPLYRQLAVEK